MGPGLGSTSMQIVRDARIKKTNGNGGNLYGDTFMAVAELVEMLVEPYDNMIHHFFTLYLSLVYTVNHFFVFPVLQKSVTKRSRSNIKFSLYLKKAGLASRNIVRT